MSELSDIEFARLFQAQFPALAFYARQWTSDSQDVVQEAFLKLARQHPPPDRPIAWLYQVVRNLALNSLRQSGRQQDHLQQWARSKPSSLSPHSLASNSLQWTAQDAVEVLQQLEEDTREIVVARIWGELSFQEISQLVGKSLPTCHRHYQQALTKIKQRLEEQIITPRKS